MPSLSAARALPSARAVEPRLRHARAAVSTLFFLNAVLYADLDAISLRVALAAVVLAGVVVVLLGRVLTHRAVAPRADTPEGPE